MYRPLRASVYQLWLVGILNRRNIYSKPSLSTNNNKYLVQMRKPFYDLFLFGHRSFSRNRKPLAVIYIYIYTCICIYLQINAFSMIWTNVTNLKKGQERKIGISLCYQYFERHLAFSIRVWPWRRCLSGKIWRNIKIYMCKVLALSSG